MKLMCDFKWNAALRYAMRNILIYGARGDVMILAHIDHEY